MEIVIRKDEKAVIVSLKGRMDAITTPALEKKVGDLISEGSNYFVINFEELEYISSMGLRAILSIAKQLKSQKGQLHVSNLKGLVKEVFEISGLSSTFNTHKVVFWGTRGSLPASITQQALRSKIFKAIEASKGVKLNTEKEINDFIDNVLPLSIKGSYGSNTSCVEIRGGDDYILCDAGTGLRDFGNHIMAAKPKIPGHFHIFLSHLHWDHIQGFPFFTPIYVPGNRIDIYGYHSDLKNAFVSQQTPPFFPVPFEALSADIRFNVLTPGKVYEIDSMQVMGFEQNHPGKSYGYSFEKNGKKLVYSTDSEHRKDAEDKGYPVLELFKDADLLIFDAQYTLVDTINTKENWGHSSNIVGVELSKRAGVKHLCLYHSEPTLDDDSLNKIQEDTRKYANLYEEATPLQISMAYDGLEVDL